MTVHAIGDRANHEVLNAYEQLRNYEKENNLPPSVIVSNMCRLFTRMTRPASAK